MDLSVDPCQDFHQFACGGWMEKNVLPESKSRWSNFDILADQVSSQLKDILRAGGNGDDIKPVNNSREMYIACMDLGKSLIPCKSVNLMK